MKIVSFNVNSINVRANALVQYLQDNDPDIICLQEIKSTKEKFPFESFSHLGYNIYIQGQKSYNGVAIFSKFPAEDVVTSLPFIEINSEITSKLCDLDENFAQARFMECLFFPKENFPLRIVNVYCPNGNPIKTQETHKKSEKFAYKLAWMQRLFYKAKQLIDLQEHTLIIGDFNIIKTTLDAKHPENFIDDALCHPHSLASLKAIENLGFIDSFRLLNSQSDDYSYWDYQAGAFKKNNGIRIDLALTSPRLTDKIVATGIDKYMRAKEKPSDHAPIWLELDIT